MIVVCPLPRTDRKHPLHVAIPPGLGVDSVVMTGHAGTVDARARRARRLGRAPDALLDEALAILDTVPF